MAPLLPREIGLSAISGRKKRDIDFCDEESEAGSEGFEGGSGKLARGFGVLAMEFVDQSLRMRKVVRTFPCVASCAVALPANLVLELPAIDAVTDVTVLPYFSPIFGDFPCLIQRARGPRVVRSPSRPQSASG